MYVLSFLMVVGVFFQQTSALAAPFQFVDVQDAQIVEMIRETARGGQKHQIGGFEREGFHLREAAALVKKYDSEVKNCAGTRDFTEEKTAAIQNYERFVSMHEVFSVGEQKIGPLVEARKMAMHRLVNDPTNLAVFSSEYNERYEVGTPEWTRDRDSGCMYSHFYIFRARGTVIRLSF